MKTAQQIGDAIVRHTVTMVGGVIVSGNHIAGDKLGLVSGLILVGIGIGQSILQKIAAAAERGQLIATELRSVERTWSPDGNTVEREIVQPAAAPVSESRLEVKTTGFENEPRAYAPGDPRRSPSTLPLILLAALLFGAGCASHKSTVLERTDKNGETTRLTRSATRTLLDSQTKLADNVVRSRSGTNVQSIAIGSLKQESSGSNVVNSLRIALEIMEKFQGVK